MTGPFTIMGAGVCGLTLAAELSGRGAYVTVVDPNGLPGAHACSWWAGGMLAPDCEGATAEPAVVAQGRKAATWWQGKGAEVHRQGTLVVALDRDQSDLSTFARRVPKAQVIGQTAIADLEPDLAGRFAGALFLPDEAHLDPRAALSALCAGLAERGVGFSEQGEGAVIDCRGLAARDRLPDLRGVKGETLLVHSADIALSRPVRLLHPRFPLYIVPRGNGVFMLGATQIESADRHRASVRSVMALLQAACALHPAFAEATVLEIGADARPAFPDNQPRMRQSGDRLFLNGLFRHGFLLAPALAQMAADLVLAGTIPEVWYEDHRER